MLVMGELRILFLNMIFIREGTSTKHADAGFKRINYSVFDYIINYISPYNKTRVISRFRGLFQPLKCVMRYPKLARIAVTRVAGCFDNRYRRFGRAGVYIRARLARCVRAG